MYGSLIRRNVIIKRAGALLIGLSMALSSLAFDDTGYIRGRVYDSQTREPLPSATVLSGRERGTTTDNNGFYFIRTGTGNISITFQYVGYKPVTRSLSVSPGDTLAVDVAMEYDIAEIDQIVVSAGKVEQRVSELTVSMHVIRPEAISSSHIADAAELINRTPGIEVIDGQASVRGGSGYSYGAGSRVLALIDGLPVLSADAGNIKWQFLPLENISQIEVIKGASSVLYGSSALNGVINFRTADAGTSPVTRFFVEGGAYGSPRQREWIWWDSPRTFSNASFSHLQKSGSTDLGVALSLLSDNGYRRLNDERLGRLSLKLNHTDRQVDGLRYGFNIVTGLTRKTDFILWEDAWTGALKQDESTAIELQGLFLAFDPHVSFQREGRYRHDLRARIQTTMNDIPDASHNNSDAFSLLAEYQFRYTFSSLVDINIGVTENFSRIASPFYGDHNSLNLAAYTQADIAPVDRLKIVAGVRVEHNSLDGVPDRPIPLFRTGVNYRILDYTFLRASYGQGYRYPSIAEKHAATTLGSVRIVPNPFIQAESGWNSEIGIKQGILTGKFNGQIDMAVFYLENQDMIEYLFGIYPDPVTGSYSYGFMATNVEQSRVYGTELEFVLNILSGRFTGMINGGYVYIHPVEFDLRTGKNRDVYLKYRRKNSFKLGTTGKYAGFDFGFTLQAGSRILNIDTVFLSELTRETILPGFYEYWNESAGGYLQIDPRLGYAFSDRFGLSLVVKNVLNYEYMGRPGDIMPQRSFSIRFSGNL